MLPPLPLVHAAFPPLPPPSHHSSDVMTRMFRAFVRRLGLGSGSVQGVGLPVQPRLRLSSQSPPPPPPFHALLSLSHAVARHPLVVASGLPVAVVPCSINTAVFDPQRFQPPGYPEDGSRAGSDRDPEPPPRGASAQAGASAGACGRACAAAGCRTVDHCHHDHHDLEGCADVGLDRDLEACAGTASLSTSPAMTRQLAFGGPLAGTVAGAAHPEGAGVIDDHDGATLTNVQDQREPEGGGQGSTARSLFESVHRDGHSPGGGPLLAAPSESVQVGSPGFGKRAVQRLPAPPPDAAVGDPAGAPRAALSPVPTGSEAQALRREPQPEGLRSWCPWGRRTVTTPGRPISHLHRDSRGRVGTESGSAASESESGFSASRSDAELPATVAHGDRRVVFGFMAR